MSYKSDWKSELEKVRSFIKEDAKSSVVNEKTADDLSLIHI